MNRFTGFFGSRLKHKMLGFLSVLMVVFMTAFPALAFIERVSVSSVGVQADSYSLLPSVSADGRYVAFNSDSTNLVAGDTNGVGDVFVYDRQTDIIERVSVTSGGAQATGGYSGNASISSDGRYVAFASDATDLVAGDTNLTGDVFVHDRQLNTTERVSVASGGAEATGGVFVNGYFKISYDGRYIVFQSDFTNLVAGDVNGISDIFVHDRQLNTTERVSVASGGAESNGSGSAWPSISSDGRYVTFASDATDLVAGDVNGVTDIFLHDRQLNTTERVSVGNSGVEAGSSSSYSSVSSDGRYVAFTSIADNLVSGNSNTIEDIYVRDRQLSATYRVSDYSGFSDDFGDNYVPNISSNGRYVAFDHNAPNLVSGDTNDFPDAFLFDSKEVSLSPSTIYENLAIGTNIGTLSATDYGVSNTHTYTFACDTPGADDASFTISGDQLNSAEVFDYETKTDYDICIRADDGNGEILDKNLTITILDAVPTDLTLSNDTIQEGNTIGDEIGTFATVMSEPGTFAYGFCGVSGPDDASFIIDGDALKAGEVFDYDTKASYEICAYTEDQSSGEIFEKNFTINITEIPPPSGGGGSSPTRIYGCTDSSATNYNSRATREYSPSSCIYSGTPGCTAPSALNYLASATVDDGSCMYTPPSNPILGCTNSQATNYQSTATRNDGSCVFPVTTPTDTDVLGCTDTLAENYSSSATKDNGSCVYPDPTEVPGCTDPQADNYNQNATTGDGSCVFPVPVDPPPPPPPPTTVNPPSTGGGGGGFLKEKDLVSVAFGGIAFSAIVTAIAEPGLVAGAASIPIRIWNMIPVLMGYRRKKRPWGTVYDSVTKQPLDPVYVTLKTKDGEEKGTSITDLDGRYGFLAEAGSYIISANKTNYIFPSVKMAGKEKDELYDSLYFGDDIQVEKKEDVVYKNIPMDAINFNWNEFEKSKNKKLMKFYSKTDLFFGRIANIAFVAGLVSSVILFFLNNSLLNTIILILYAAIIILRMFGVKPRKSGRVVDSEGFPLSFGIVRVFSSSNREVAHSIVGKTGKYYMLVPNGEYFAKIQKKTGEDSYEDIYTTDTFNVKSGYVGEKIKIS